MKLKKLSRIDSTTLECQWIDDLGVPGATHAGRVSLTTLRDRCPCAGCQGESVLFMQYTPPPDANPHPRKYELASAETVGSYAMKFTWGDGHDQGLYTWEHLRSLCECSVCVEARVKGAPRA